MQVFNLYYKLLKKQLTGLIIYFTIFLALIITMSLSSDNNSNKSFKGTKVKIAYINRDTNSTYLTGFHDYLKNSCNFISIKDSKKSIQDALFYRKISYIIIIPKGFTDKFMQQQSMKLIKMTVPDSADSAFIDIAINNYMNAAKLYLSSNKTISQEELVKALSKDLESKVNVDIYRNHNNTMNKYDKLVTLYNYFAYGLVSILILGIGSIMVSFTKVDIKRRNTVAPISIPSMNFQQILGNLTITFAATTSLIISGFVLYHELPINRNILLFMLNAYIFSLPVLSIAYLVGLFIKSKDAGIAISNIVGLGFCFLCGVFVPREMLGKSVLDIAKFTPTYWYVDANEKIGKLTNFSFSNVATIFYSMLIELGFAIALISISLVLSKKKRTEIF